MQLDKFSMYSKCYLVLCMLVLSIFFIAAYSGSVNPRSAQRWRGAQMNNLIHQWGTPNAKIKQSDGSTILLYRIITSRSPDMQRSPEVGVNVSGGRPVIVTPSPNMNPAMRQGVSLSCDVEFKANQRGIITSVRMSGPGC